MIEHDAAWWMRKHATASNMWQMCALMVHGRRNEDVFRMLSFQHYTMVLLWQVIAGPCAPIVVEVRE